MARKSSTKDGEDKRSTSWTMIVYPDSVPDNWEYILRDLHIPVAISPLHDADVTSDGEEKKSHWHVFLKFDSLKSYSQVCEVSKTLNCTIPKIVQSGKGLIRYFCHLDDPNKAQYKIEDIKTFGGFDVSQYIAPTVRERHSILADMIDHIDLHHVTEVKDFVGYCRQVHFDDWFPVLCGSSFRLIESYIRSCRNVKWRDAKKISCDDSIDFNVTPDGEIVE